MPILHLQRYHIDLVLEPWLDQTKAVFSSADLVAAESLLRTVAHCSILFFSVKNCLKIN
jgi:hypothetical protein